MCKIRFYRQNCIKELRRQASKIVKFYEILVKVEHILWDIFFNIKIYVFIFTIFSSYSSDESKFQSFLDVIVIMHWHLKNVNVLSRKVQQNLSGKWLPWDYQQKRSSPFYCYEKKDELIVRTSTKRWSLSSVIFCPWDKKLKGFISLFVRETIFLSQRYIKGEITEIRKVLCFVIQYRGGFWGWIFALIDNGIHSYYCISQISQELLWLLSLIHISEPTRPLYISYAVFCLKKTP
mgnify:CR=1 FL=1